MHIFLRHGVYTHRPQGVNYHGYLHVLKYLLLLLLLLLLYLRRKE